ncbi:MAG TPA: hypothetical protein PK293_05875, partial [Spirochaetota bacterium]|nr:hypothetical protein [Spirochaetota bacterium]
ARMKKDDVGKEVTILKKSITFDNPILRHFVKKHSLDEKDSVVLGVLLELTNQTRTDIKTHYNLIAEAAELSSMDVYQSINALHRYRIIDYKPEGKFLHVSFNEIEETIEEIALAYINARKIKQLEGDVSFMKRMNYISSDDLFDRISPLVGKLIASKIAEAFRALVNYVNDRLESVLSSRMWRFRYIAFRTKLPLGEVILKESLACVVDEVLIIEKKSSLLLGHASRHEEAGTDRDVVVAMLSAIMDFIRTSFKKNKKGDESGALLNGIEFGDSRIIVQESPYFYSAFVVQGAPGIDFLTGSDSLSASIHESFRMKLKKFDGSMYGLEGIRSMLEEFITKMNMVVVPGRGENRDFRKLKIAAGIASVIFMFWAGFTIRGEVLDYRLEKKFYAAASEKIEKFSYDIEADAEGDELLITGLVSTPAISEELNSIASGFSEIKNVDNRTVVADFRTAEKYHSSYMELEQKFNDLQILLIRQELEKIVIQFPSGVDTMGNSQMLQVRRIYEIVKEYPRIHLDIIAFNDPQGGFDVNKRLAEGRMSGVGSYLESLGISKDRIHLTEFNPDVISADPRYAGYIDRRGIMLFARLEK